MKRYTSTESVRAEKITDSDGREVITSDGPIHAPDGAYVVVYDSGRVTVCDGEDFESRFTSGGSSTGSSGSGSGSTTKKTTTSRQSAKKSTPAKKRSLPAKKTTAKK